MRVVITVSLDNRAYPIEEEAYTALRQYMDRAKAGLQNNPDVSEILGDVERAIGEKCAGVLHSGKNVVSSEAMASILHEVGPVVEDPVAGPAPFEGSADRPTPEPKRLYRQPKGAMVEGVCMGLAEYFGVDVVIFRLLFAILTVASGGIGGGLYLLMVMIVPSREPVRPRTKALRRIHPAIWVASAVLILLAVLTFVPWLSRDVSVDWRIPYSIPRGFGIVEGLMILAVPMFALGAIVVTIVLVARYFGREKQ